ncbi:ATP-binding protein [bacterium]|nr:ATP-binding protein [bacterium]
MTTEEHKSTPLESLPYNSTEEYLQAALRGLDLRLQREVQRFRKFRHAGLGALQGIVISAEEIDRALSGDDHAGPSAATEEDSMKNLEQQLAESEQAHRQRAEATLAGQRILPILHLANLFHLNLFEEYVLLIVIAPEIEVKYERIFAYLQDNSTRCQPGVDLILRLLCRDQQQRLIARGLFSPRSALVKNRLVQLRPASPTEQSLLASLVLVNQRILEYALGHQSLDARLGEFASLDFASEPNNVLAADRERIEHLRNICARHFQNGASQSRLLFLFEGRHGIGKKTAAKALCDGLQVPLLIIDVEQLLLANTIDDDVLLAAFREAILQPCAVFLDHFHLLMNDEAQSRVMMKKILQHIRDFCWLTFLGSEKAWIPADINATLSFISVNFEIPDEAGREQLWRWALNGAYPAKAESDFAISDLATKFRFTPGQINEAVCMARGLAQFRDPEHAEIDQQDLYRACREKSTNQLGELARKIRPRRTWQDMVLPAAVVRQLHEICAQVRHRYQVLRVWGYGRKVHHHAGLAAMFAGPSGTGKTMAAEIIAGELQQDLYKIDLSAVVSKYIGETEKNLHRVFAAAEYSNAILFFDEADALFGRRSEVKDAHDRYANIEISYLLQKIEEYDGVVILATNLKRNIDEAFLRRIQFCVEFPFPDAAARRLIWQNHFPAEAPLAGEVDLDFLANRFKFAGGNIKNVAVNAAFLAAEAGSQIGMSEVIAATRREYEKIGKLCLPSDFGKYHEAIDG